MAYVESKFIDKGNAAMTSVAPIRVIELSAQPTSGLNHATLKPQRRAYLDVNCHSQCVKLTKRDDREPTTLQLYAS